MVGVPRYGSSGQGSRRLEEGADVQLLFIISILCSAAVVGVGDIVDAGRFCVAGLGVAGFGVGDLNFVALSSSYLVDIDGSGVPCGELLPLDGNLLGRGSDRFLVCRLI